MKYHAVVYNLAYPSDIPYDSGKRGEEPFATAKDAEDHAEGMLSVMQFPPDDFVATVRFEPETAAERDALIVAMLGEDALNSNLYEEFAEEQQAALVNL